MAGMMMGVGIALVGCFPLGVTTSLHFFSATVYFLSGAVFTVLFSRISLLMSSDFCGALLAKTRCSISFALLVANGVFLVFHSMAFWKFEGENVARWLPEQGGHFEHAVAAVAEWLVVVFPCLEVLTTVVDFIRFGPKVEFKIIGDNYDRNNNE